MKPVGRRLVFAAIWVVEWVLAAEPEGTGVVRGIAVDEQGMRVPHAIVYLKGIDPDSPFFRSNDRKKGESPLPSEIDFEFSGLKAGTYELSGVGERPNPVAVELAAGQMIREEVRVPIDRKMDLIQRTWFAVLHDQPDQVRELLAAGADPNYTNQRHTLLTLAATHAGLEVVRLLVEAGAEVDFTPDPNERDEMREPNPFYALSTGLTPYEHALWNGKSDMAEYLLAQGASTNDLIRPPPGLVRGSVVDEDGQPIDELKITLDPVAEPGQAIESGGVRNKTAYSDARGNYVFPSLEVGTWELRVPQMAPQPAERIELTADAPLKQMPPLRIPPRAVYTQKLLGYSLTSYSPEELQSLLDNGADVHCADGDGSTPLMRLARWGKLDGVRVLVKAGADLDAEDENGLTAIDHATQRKRPEIIAYLLEQGARPSNEVPPPPGRIGGILLDEQGRPLPRIPLRCSPGEEAKMLDPVAFTGMDGRFSFIRLEAGDYDVRLFSAPEILLSAELDAPDFAVTNAVLRCARAAAVDLALGLHLQVDSPYVADVLQAGADPNRTNALGQTALMIATENGCPKAVQALLDAGANVDATDPEGETVLHLACQRGDGKIAARLTAAGAKLDATNRAGRTPLDVAVWEGREEVAQQLRALGAPGSVAESKALGALSGTVRDETGAPVAHASVQCTLVGDEIEGRYGDITDRAGRYRVGRLPLGTYAVQIDFGAENRKTVVLSKRDETVEGVDFQKSGSGQTDWKRLPDGSFLDRSIARRLKEGADPNERDPKYGHTALHRAASEPQPRNVQILLNAGADVDATNRWGQTALMIAAEKGQSGNVELMLKAGADVERIDDDGCSALHLACKNGNRNAVKRLVEAGADLARTNRWGRTPLDEAVWENRPEVAKMLRAAGAPGTLTEPQPDGTIRGIVVDEKGAPLRNVVIHVQRQAGGTNKPGGHVELRTGADGSFRMDGETAGCYRFASVSRLDDPVVVCLTNDWDAQLDVRVQVSRRCVQEAALFAAVADDDPEAAERALAEGADPCAVDGDNESLLDMALNQWATNVVPTLLAHGADLNAPNADGYTPLRHAARNWLSWKIPYLLRMGAAVRPEEGGSPLLLLDVVRREPGEDEKKRDFRRLRIAWCAKSARLLIAAGADLGVRDENGMTPLHHAALNGYAECAKVLMNAHIDESATNAAGQTALDLAVAAGQDEVAVVLRRGAPAGK